MGSRKDPRAEKHRIPNSADNVGAEKGTLPHLEAFDKPATQGVYLAPTSDLRQENTQPAGREQAPRWRRQMPSHPRAG